MWARTAGHKAVRRWRSVGPEGRGRGAEGGVLGWVARLSCGEEPFGTGQCIRFGASLTSAAGLRSRAEASRKRSQAEEPTEKEAVRSRAGKRFWDGVRCGQHTCATLATEVRLLRPSSSKSSSESIAAGVCRRCGNKLALSWRPQRRTEKEGHGDGAGVAVKCAGEFFF